MQYYSTFPEGFSEIAKAILLERNSQIEIHQLGKDYIYYSTKTSIEKIRQYIFFEQTFLLIKYFGDKDKDFSNQTNWFYQNASSINFKLEVLGRESTYRIVGSASSLDNGRIQTEINRLDRVVSIDRGNANYDIRIVEKEDHGFIGIRLTKPAEFADYLQKGSLRKEIAYYMLYLSGMQRKDVFLDPFCGGGIIPMLRSQITGYKEIIATDVNIDLINKKVNQARLGGEKIKIIKSEVKNLSNVLFNKVNKIVTDPPWGLIEKIDNKESFYKEMFETFGAIVSPNAKIVLLTPYVDIVKNVLASDVVGFSIDSVITGKVSGRESSIINVIN